LAAATSYRAKASRSLAPSTQLKSDSAEVGRERQHSLHLEHLPLQIVELIGSKKLQIFGEQQGVFPLRPPNREQLEGTSSSRDLISDHTTSAMFAPMEAEAHRSRLVNPYISFFRDAWVYLYTNNVSS
jgi:hypothetical protein